MIREKKKKITDSFEQKTTIKRFGSAIERLFFFINFSECRTVLKVSFKNLGFLPVSNTNLCHSQKEKYRMYCENCFKTKQKTKTKEKNQHKHLLE